MLSTSIEKNQTTLSQTQLLATLQQQFQKGVINPNDLNPVAGSFKLVAHCVDTIGIAWNRENAAYDVFQKEGKLLSYMQSIGLPALPVYSVPFKLPNDKYAVLIEWIPNATLLDVKDGVDVHRKLTAFTTGVTIPTQEGWVLQKDKIEDEIRQKITSNDKIFSKTKILAKELHSKLTNILNILNTKKILIADFQLLISPAGEVKIIDPIDVIQLKSTNIPNQHDYESILDKTTQRDPDFIQLLHDGKMMVRHAMAWCAALSTTASQEDWVKFMLNGSSGNLSTDDTGNLPTLLLKRSQKTKIQPKHKIRAMKISKQPQSKPKPQIPETPRLPLHQITPTPHNSPVKPKTPNSSPKKALAVVLGKENSPENSPSKELIFRFSALQLPSEKKPLNPTSNVRRKLNFNTMI